MPIVVYTESHWPAKETEARQGRGHTGRKRPGRALTAGSAAPESQLNKYLLKESEGGSWRLVSAVAPCPAGPLILFLEFTEGGLGSCQLTPPWPHAELWVTPAAPQDLLATAGKDTPDSGEETEVQRRLGLGPKPHSVLAVAVRPSDISLPQLPPPPPFQGRPPTGWPATWASPCLGGAEGARAACGRLPGFLFLPSPAARRPQCGRLGAGLRPGPPLLREGAGGEGRPPAPRPQVPAQMPPMEG